MVKMITVRNPFFLPMSQEFIGTDILQKWQAQISFVRKLCDLYIKNSSAKGSQYLQYSFTAACWSEIISRSPILTVTISDDKCWLIRFI